MLKSGRQQRFCSYTLPLSRRARHILTSQEKGNESWVIAIEPYLHLEDSLAHYPTLKT